MSLAELPTDTSVPGRSVHALFAVDVTVSERETVLTMRGELDLWTRPLFESALAGIDDRAPRVVLDLSDVTFVDASTIGCIDQLQQRARRAGGDIVIRSPRPHVQRILELTGVLSDGSGAGERPDVTQNASFSTRT